MLLLKPALETVAWYKTMNMPISNICKNKGGRCPLYYLNESNVK